MNNDRLRFTRDDIQAFASMLVDYLFGRGGSRVFGVLRVDVEDFLSPAKWIAAISDNERVQGWVERALVALEKSTSNRK